MFMMTGQEELERTPDACAGIGSQAIDGAITLDGVITELAKEHVIVATAGKVIIAKIIKRLGLIIGRMVEQCHVPVGPHRRAGRILELAITINQHLTVIGIGTGGDLTIDPTKRQTILKGENVDLTAKEFDLLLHFAQNPGRVYTRAQLLDIVWGYGHDGYEHTVNSHINRLRAKIECDPAKPQYVITVWGVGYKFSHDIQKSST